MRRWESGAKYILRELARRQGINSHPTMIPLRYRVERLEDGCIGILEVLADPRTRGRVVFCAGPSWWCRMAAAEEGSDWVYLVGASVGECLGKGCEWRPGGCRCRTFRDRW